MPKQPPKNGYFYFMQDFRTREEAQGRRFRGGNAEVATAASEEWKSLTQEERDSYNDFAKQNRHNQVRMNVPKKLEKKFNSLGVSFAQMEKEQKEKEARELEINNFVREFVKGKDIDNLRNDLIYLIHVNIFCKTDDDTYYPAELAICKFNIKEGPIDTYHTFIDPMEIKKGYKFAVKEHSDKTHKITLSFVQENLQYREHEKIYDQICNFLQLGENTSVPLFTMYDDVFHNTSLLAVEKTLETLWHGKHSVPMKNEAWRKYFPVYPLPLLFTHLKNYCFFRAGFEEEAFPNSSLAISELNKDTYNFRDEYGCEFHQKVDAVVHCSLSYVLRWCQILRDHCTEPLGIQMFAETNTCGDMVSEYEYGTAASVIGPASDDDYDEGDDDPFTDCQSVVSKISSKTTRTNMSDTSVGYLPEKGSNSVENAGQTATAGSLVSGASTVWSGGSRGRAQKIAPIMDDKNFPSLAGIGRGLRRMKLDQ